MTVETLVKDEETQSTIRYIKGLGIPEKLDAIDLIKDLKYFVDNCDVMGIQLSQKKIGKIIENYRNFEVIPEKEIYTLDFQSEELINKFGNECSCRKIKRKQK